MPRNSSGVGVQPHLKEAAIKEKYSSWCMSSLNRRQARICLRAGLAQTSEDEKTFRGDHLAGAGALMNTRGLMELIALNIGFDLGILSPRIFTMLVIMALITTMLTGPLLTLFGRNVMPTTGIHRLTDYTGSARV